MTRQSILTQAIATYGTESQCLVAIEEMSELTKALTKIYRYGNRPDLVDNVLEELADVRIMLDQMQLIFDPQGQPGCRVADHEAYKLGRLAERLKIN